jgi:hypothetical protein
MYPAMELGVTPEPLSALMVLLGKGNCVVLA